MNEVQEICAEELKVLKTSLSRVFDRVEILEAPASGVSGRAVRVGLNGDEHWVAFTTPLRLSDGDMFGQTVLLKCMVTVDGGNAERERERLYTDGLTGARNRLCFEELGFVSEKGCPVSFIMTDVRDFKSINDNYGHPVGDVALQKTVAVMKSHIRATDAVIRMGGDEFLIVLYHCGQKAARWVAEKIRENLRTEAVFDEKLGLSTYINVGIDSRESFDGSEETCRAMYAKADREMYIDKHGS